MPSLSKKQQKFMGIVRSIQKGEQPASKFSKDARDAAKDMKKSSVKKFAKTKHKGLPTKVKKEYILNKLKETIKQEMKNYTYGSGDIVKDVNPTCPHYGAMGKVKSVNPRSVVFVVMNKGKNFKPGMELEKSHDQMKKMNEGSMDWEKKHFPWANKKEQMMIAKLVFQNKDGIDGEVKHQKKNPSSYKNHIKRMVKKGLHESVNEMSVKSKKIINKLNKKEKEMFMDMVDMMGFDQVMADYKRDKKAFKQALKDMSESVIKEYVKPNVFNNNFDKAMNMVIKQANNLKGPLAKHPIKRNLNKLKAVQKLYKKFIAPALVVKDSNLEYDFDFAEIEKKLKDGKFKSAIEYSIMNKIGGGGFRSNSFYMLDDKTNKLRDRISGELRKIVNILDKAQLESVEEGFGSDDTINKKEQKKFEKERVENAEVLGYELTGVKDVKENINEDTYIGHYKNKKVKINAKSDKEAHKQIISKLKVPKKDYDIASIQNLTKKTKTIGDKLYVDSVNEDGHTDVASSKRKVMIMVDDSNELLSKLNGMDKEGSLPSWWSDKITLSQKYLAKAKDYLLNPVESVNEGRGVEKVLKMANDQSFGKLGGRTVDALSAGLFKGVYEKAPQNAKDKINKMNEKQLYVFMTKLWSKFGNQVRIG